MFVLGVNWPHSLQRKQQSWNVWFLLLYPLTELPSIQVLIVSFHPREFLSNFQANKFIEAKKIRKVAKGTSREQQYYVSRSLLVPGIKL